MPTVELTDSDIEEAFSKLILQLTGVSKTEKPDYVNKYGIMVHRNKKDPYTLLYSWITPDLLWIDLKIELHELAEHGKLYIDSRADLIIDQVNKARQQRQESESIELRNPAAPLPPNEPIKTTAAAAAVNEVLH